jgi:murein DD-endopeptidase MepM/ murein hydrolase activator NlpD
VTRSYKHLFISVFVLVATLLPAGPVAAEDGVTTSSKPLIWPTTGRMTQRYGCTGFAMEPRYGSCRHFHGGIDVANKSGTPIRAAAAGTIVHVGWDRWGTRNWMVILKHENGLKTWYAHMQHRSVDGIKEGLRVRQGQLVGYMGSTGWSTGTHLHWAVLKNGRYANPNDYVQGQLRREGDSGTGEPTGGVASCDGPVIVTAVSDGSRTAAVLETEQGGESTGPTSCVA